MEVAPTIAQPETDACLLTRERRCLVTGEVRPKHELIRFVLGPAQSVVPDLAENLPGRGLWVTASRDIILTAVQKNLFSKAAKAPAVPKSDLADQVASLLHKRCLDFIGLARRSGILILGQPQVEAALKISEIRLLLTANTASQNLAYRCQVREIRRFSRDDLSAALGHANLVYVGLKAHRLTAKLQIELTRLENIAPMHHLSLGNG
jgi:predicted RNA-binding protein YlxR (DUF448 family)